jgi:hypothetical protein
MTLGSAWPRVGISINLNKTKISSPRIPRLNVPGGVLRTLGDVDTDPGILLLQREIAQAKASVNAVIITGCFRPQRIERVSVD